MKFKDRIKFANDNPLTHIATVEGDQPRVRGFSIQYTDESGSFSHRCN